VAAMEFMEDYKFTGAFRINYGLQDNEVYLRFDNLRKRLDWGLAYYRSSTSVGLGQYSASELIHIYQANVNYPLNEVQSFRLFSGIRRTVINIKSDDLIPSSLTEKRRDENYALGRLEFVHDNTINPVTNIWRGFRAKAWMEAYNRLGGNYTGGGRDSSGDFTFNFGFDARHYLKIYRNFIWAVRAAADFSWGNNKFIYYLGGTDGWLMLGQNDVVRKGVAKQRYFNTSNRPANDQSYVYESLAVNMRGFLQNSANGNNAMVINSELRLPVFTTLFNRPINNAFLRNFQLVQFFDFGTAWNGKYTKIGRPEITYNEPGSPLTVAVKAPGIGPFLGSYGFGARSTLLGYFLRLDAGWPMSGFFNEKPKLQLSIGLDF
jgi:outer membrane protein assembly factor BamA